MNDQDEFAYLSEPEKIEDKGRPYWVYRRGGYNPADGTYGRCGTKEDAEAIIRKNASGMGREEPGPPPSQP